MSRFDRAGEGFYYLIVLAVVYCAIKMALYVIFGIVYVIISVPLAPGILLMECIDSVFNQAEYMTVTTAWLFSVCSLALVYFLSWLLYENHKSKQDKLYQFTDVLIMWAIITGISLALLIVLSCVGIDGFGILHGMNVLFGRC